MPGMPSLDPVHRGGANSYGRGRGDFLLRQLRCHPRAVSQGSLFGSAGDGRVVVYFDGGSRGNPGPAAIGAVVWDESGEVPTRVADVSEYIGPTTNNVAEYRAVIAGLEAALSVGARRVL